MFHCFPLSGCTVYTVPSRCSRITMPKVRVSARHCVLRADTICIPENQRGSSADELTIREPPGGEGQGTALLTHAARADSEAARLLDRTSLLLPVSTSCCSHLRRDAFRSPGQPDRPGADIL